MGLLYLSEKYNFISYFIPKSRFEISVVLFFLTFYSQNGGTYLTNQVNSVHCTNYSNNLVTAASVWPNCRPDTNLFCWARHSEDFGRQLASRIGFSVATITGNKEVEFYFSIWSLSRQLCCVGSGSSVGLRPLASWDCGFEFRQGAWMPVVNFVCCQVDVSEMDRSLFQRSPTECLFFIYLFIYYLRLGRHPVAGVF